MEAGGGAMERLPRHRAYEYAEWIRARLPEALKRERVRADLTKYGLQRESGIGREMIARIERGEAKPSLVLVAQLARGLGLTMAEFVRRMEEYDGADGTKKTSPMID